MAIVRDPLPPVVGCSWWDVYDFPPSLFDQRFGTVLLPSDFIAPYLRDKYMVRKRSCVAVASSGESVVKNEENRFKVTLDVRDFAPEEIKVKVTNNCIVIHGDHEPKTDEHSNVHREFTRRYMLPAGIEPRDFKSSMSGDGLIIIEAPKVIEPKVIETAITQT